MYLTKEEFEILNALKKGYYTSFEIKEQTGIQLRQNDPRLFALYKKYGVSGNLSFAKQELIKKADLNKIEIVEDDQMPYFEYEGKYLVKKMKITKKDVLALSKYFKDIQDEDNEKEEYELILNKDWGNMYRFLTIKNLKTNEETELISEVG